MCLKTSSLSATPGRVHTHTMLAYPFDFPNINDIDSLIINSIRANKPQQSNRMIAYFEITVLEAGARGSIMIGLTDIDVPLNRHPGWEDKY